MIEAGEGLLAGIRQFKFMRALYGLIVCLTIAVVVTFLTRPEPKSRRRGLVWGTVADAIKHYKGSPGRERHTRGAKAKPHPTNDDVFHKSTGLPLVRMSSALADALGAESGDLVYVSDRRVWLGGLHSTHAIVEAVIAGDTKSLVELGPTAWNAVVKPGREAESIRLELLY